MGSDRFILKVRFNFLHIFWSCFFYYIWYSFQLCIFFPWWEISTVAWMIIINDVKIQKLAWTWLVFLHCTCIDLLSMGHSGWSCCIQAGGYNVPSAEDSKVTHILILAREIVGENHYTLAMEHSRWQCWI
jgi:hypothetical protein